MSSYLKTSRNETKGKEAINKLTNEFKTNQQKRQDLQDFGEFNSYLIGGGISGVDINALIENALYQTKVDPEVVIAAARLFVLANQARNYNGYCFVESNQNVVEATNRSSAMSLSNLLLPDEASQSSKTT
ncbi:3851_t:CDS:2 [Entrophospora sp. SA101]|nr:382_t:CDS:2 [Entrophospora sp. SA101]CAJ0905338.1 3851_t:CDS:2 [Entrophospora sp. SA101]